MDALFLIIKLLEKVSVLVAAVSLLVMIRPAGSWLGESGKKASPRRKVFLILVLGGLAIWGTFLGLEVEGFRFNVRMVGIIVAGILGGWAVGGIVGLSAGIAYAMSSGSDLVIYAVAASVLVGILSGIWSQRYGTRLVMTALGAFVIQITYHLLVGGVMAILDFENAAAQASNMLLHSAKIAANVIGSVLFIGVLNLIGELERARESAKHSKVEARNAKLEALQYQVKPHFLFNILNTLSFLIRTQPERARALTLDLSEFLRYTLATESDQTTLSEELKQITKYVDLERARFGEGLSFIVDLENDVELESLGVPPLILQPLVENAIRYGTINGRVEIKILATKIKSDHFKIRVIDNGPGIKKDARRNGVGLKNVQERLDKFFQNRVDFVLENTGKGAEAKIEIFPKKQIKFIDEARRRLEEVV